VSAMKRFLIIAAALLTILACLVHLSSSPQRPSAPILIAR